MQLDIDRSTMSILIPKNRLCCGFLFSQEKIYLSTIIASFHQQNVNLLVLIFFALREHANVCRYCKRFICCCFFILLK